MKLITILSASFALLASSAAFAAEPCNESTTKYVNKKYCGGAGVASCNMVSGNSFTAKCNPPPGKPNAEGKTVSGKVTKATPMKQKKKSK